MLHNDISNRQCPILAFNIDNLLFTDTDPKNMLDRFINKMSSSKHKYLNRDINKSFASTIEYLWSKHPYSIYFITLQPYAEDLEALIIEHNIPFTALEHFDNLEELRDRVKLRYIYYFDSDASILSIMSSNNALDIKDIFTVIR